MISPSLILHFPALFFGFLFLFSVMDSSKEEDVPVFLDRSSRMTRGKRYRTTSLGFLLLGVGFVVNWHELMEDVSNCMYL